MLTCNTNSHRSNILQNPSGYPEHRKSIGFSVAHGNETKHSTLKAIISLCTGLTCNDQLPYTQKVLQTVHIEVASS